MAMRDLTKDQKQEIVIEEIVTEEFVSEKGVRYGSCDLTEF